MRLDEMTPEQRAVEYERRAKEAEQAIRNDELRKNLESARSFLEFGALAVFLVLGGIGTVLLIMWSIGQYVHSPVFCQEETAAVAGASLKCESRGQKLEFLEKKDRTWAVCRCQ